MVFCYHHDSGCTATFPVRDRKDHEKNYCTFILKRDKIVEDFLPEKLLIYCAYCSVYVQVKDLQYHLLNKCPFRIVPCVHTDCLEKIQYHNLKKHLRYECNSKNQKLKAWFVQIARTKRNYPRPWGTEMIFSTNNDRLDHSLNIKNRNKNGDNNENGENSNDENNNDGNENDENDYYDEDNMNDESDERGSDDSDTDDYRKYEV